jgi:hypothetical protein
MLSRERNDVAEEYLGLVIPVGTVGYASGIQTIPKWRIRRPVASDRFWASSPETDRVQ